MHPAYRAGELPGSGVLFPYAEMVGRPLSHVDPSVSLTADSSPYQGEPLLGTGDADCHTSDDAHWLAMTHNKRCSDYQADRCGERAERRRWRMKRGERVAAVKIGGVRRKAARKFWAPQQDHRPLRKARCETRDFSPRRLSANKWPILRIHPSTSLRLVPLPLGKGGFGMACYKRYSVRRNGPMWASAPTDA